MSIISLILAIAKAVPIVNAWIEQLSVLYVAQRYATLKKENREAIDLAKNEHDQRGIEHALNSPNAGKQSGDAGAVVVDQPPPNIVHK